MTDVDQDLLLIGAVLAGAALLLLLATPLERWAEPGADRPPDDGSRRRGTTQASHNGTNETVGRGPRQIRGHDVKHRATRER